MYVGARVCECVYVCMLIFKATTLLTHVNIAQDVYTTYTLLYLKAIGPDSMSQLRYDKTIGNVPVLCLYPDRCP